MKNNNIKTTVNSKIKTTYKQQQYKILKTTNKQTKNQDNHHKQQQTKM